MATTTAQVRKAQAHLLVSIAASEYGDIRSILDEYLPSPLWSEQVEMTRYLGRVVVGALYSYDGNEGWTYVEEGA